MGRDASRTARRAKQYAFLAPSIRASILFDRSHHLRPQRVRLDVTQYAKQVVVVLDHRPNGRVLVPLPDASCAPTVIASNAVDLVVKVYREFRWQPLTLPGRTSRAADDPSSPKKDCRPFPPHRVVFIGDSPLSPCPPCLCGEFQIPQPVNAYCHAVQRWLHCIRNK